jgi:hypothetical protein
MVAPVLVPVYLQIHRGYEWSLSHSCQVFHRPQADTNSEISFRLFRTWRTRDAFVLVMMLAATDLRGKELIIQTLHGSKIHPCLRDRTQEGQKEK